jgi:hypothetical protein
MARRLAAFPVISIVHRLDRRLSKARDHKIRKFPHCDLVLLARAKGLSSSIDGIRRIVTGLFVATPVPSARAAMDMEAF